MGQEGVKKGEGEKALKYEGHSQIADTLSLPLGVLDTGRKKTTFCSWQSQERRLKG